MTSQPQSAPAHPAREHPHYVGSILAALREEPEHTVVRWRDRAVSARELSGAVVTAAAGLAAHGVGPETILGILTEPNSPDMLVARYAAHLLGAGVVHVGSTNAVSSGAALPAAAQRTALQETGAALLVVDAANAARAREIRAHMPGTLALACLSGPADGFLDLTAEAGDEEVLTDPLALAALAPQVPGVTTYTSGSTGRPKGVRRSLTAWNHMVATTVDSGHRPQMLVTTPLSHTIGPMADATIASGGSVVLHEEFEAGAFLEAMSAHRVTRTFLAVPHIYALLDHPAFASADLTSLQQLVYGGCPASPARLEQALRAFGPALIQTYGTTESWGISVLTPPDHLRPELLGAAGRPIPGVAVVIRDPETGRELPPAATGEVCVQSPVMMDGYWGDDDRSRSALRDGWLYTGDIGCLDDEGYLYLVGRLDDVIKSKGEKVHPAAVESALLSHPRVSQAAVFGVRDGDKVDHVHATVVLYDGPDGNPGSGQEPDSWLATLREHVTTTLSPFHAPAVIALRERMPLTASGKPDKQLLRTEALASSSGPTGEH
ncbi:class I adenylate-forming enzyme family protein [Streptomyces sp. NPDC053427]|uniref:class I adenylate-forming enzyme family protein n=1 Tax=Streptomyces sp. NPDC053427 TaxID=3365701 RepID=UPI0037D3A417